jgi:hypothetical protein
MTTERNEPPSDSIPPDEVLPCGCVLRCAVVDEGVRTLTLIPCRTSCVNYRKVLRLTAEKGITPEFRRAP